MTDWAKRICDEWEVSREEAIYNLEGFEGEEGAVKEACRSKTLELPSITVESPSKVPAKEKSTSEAPSKLQFKTDSLRSPNQPDERSTQSRDELIMKFCTVLVGADVQEAAFYLEHNEWDVQGAILHFLKDHRPTASQRKLNRKLRRSDSQPFSGDDTSVAATLMSMCEGQTPKARPRMVSSQLKLQESTSPVQAREEKLSPVKESAEAPPSSMSSSQLPNSPEQLSQLQEESIKLFREVAMGASRKAAIACLKLCNWNEDDAINFFFKDHTEAIPEIAMAEADENLKSKAVDEDLSTESLDEAGGDYIPEARPLMASSQEKLQESTSPVQTREEKLSPVKESAEAPLSSMSSSQLPNFPEKLSQLQVESIKSFREVAIGAFRKAANACLKRCKWNEEDAIDYTEAIPGSATAEVDENLKGKAVDEDASTKSLEEAGGEYIPEARPLMASFQEKIQNIQESSSLTQTREETLSPVKESAEVAPPMVIDSRTSSNQLQNSPEQQSQLQLIDSFVELAGGGVTRDDALVYLRFCNWDVDQAFYYLMEEGSHVFSEKETSQVQASHGSRNLGYLEEGETWSSSSSSNTDPTETGNITVAIPGIASSQLDEHLKDKAVDEDSSTELSDDYTIELEIWLTNGESGTQVWIPVRSDETVRDIREKVEAFRPENNRDYYFKSDTGVDYRDLNTTMHRITSGSRGSTTLHQVYST